MWREFFDSQAPHYDENPFTQHTPREIDFLLTLYVLPANGKILDIGCGTGRHSIELAKRGYQVTGIDFSEKMLEVARKKADDAGVTVNWVLADARSLDLGDQFDAAFCLCEGAVGILEKGEDPVGHDLGIYQNVAKHLKPNAPFVVTSLNGYSVIRQMKDEFVADGRFDPATMISNYVDEWNLPDGTRQIQIFERLFIAPEVVSMLKQAGFQVDAVYGGTAGYWGQRALSLDEVEAMFVCRKRV